MPTVVEPAPLILPGTTLDSKESRRVILHHEEPEKLKEGDSHTQRELSGDRVLECYCNPPEPALHCISMRSKKIGRGYYTCRKRTGGIKGCNFFEWEDDAKHGEATALLDETASQGSPPSYQAPPLLFPSKSVSLVEKPNIKHGESSQYPRKRDFPPVNPADQNPPCNTLYVGNLPVNASEDKVKAIFFKQPGFKRLVFRTKQNGPMCFVEFEDTAAATEALNKLYGHPFEYSMEGGIRLSFSKNPLGVKAAQRTDIKLTSPKPHLEAHSSAGARADDSISIKLSGNHLPIQSVAPEYVMQHEPQSKDQSSDQRPYKCSACGISFSRLENQRMHQCSRENFSGNRDIKVSYQSQSTSSLTAAVLQASSEVHQQLNTWFQESSSNVSDRLAAFYSLPGAPQQVTAHPYPQSIGPSMARTQLHQSYHSRTTTTTRGPSPSARHDIQPPTFDDSSPEEDSFSSEENYASDKETNHRRMPPQQDIQQQQLSVRQRNLSSYNRMSQSQTLFRRVRESRLSTTAPHRDSFLRRPSLVQSEPKTVSYLDSPGNAKIVVEATKHRRRNQYMGGDTVEVSPETALNNTGGEANGESLALPIELGHKPKGEEHKTPAENPPTTPLILTLSPQRLGRRDSVPDSGTLTNDNADLAIPSQQYQAGHELPKQPVRGLKSDEDNNLHVRKRDVELPSSLTAPSEQNSELRLPANLEQRTTGRNQERDADCERVEFSAKISTIRLLKQSDTEDPQTNPSDQTNREVMAPPDLKDKEIVGKFEDEVEETSDADIRLSQKPTTIDMSRLQQSHVDLNEQIPNPLQEAIILNEEKPLETPEHNNEAKENARNHMPSPRNRIDNGSCKTNHFPSFFKRALAMAKVHARPKIRHGYKRLEWTCTCGEAMYGDYKCDDLNALQSFQRQLREELTADKIGNAGQKTNRTNESAEADSALSDVARCRQLLNEARNLYGDIKGIGGASWAGSSLHEDFKNRGKTLFEEVKDIAQRSKTSSGSWTTEERQCFEEIYDTLRLLSWARSNPGQTKHSSGQSQSTSLPLQQMFQDAASAPNNSATLPANASNSRSGSQLQISNNTSSVTGRLNSTAPNVFPLSGGTNFSSPISAQPIDRFFELCVNTGTLSVSLGEIPLTSQSTSGIHEVQTDGAFFALVHARYHALRHRRRFGFLFKPVDIQFVRFGVIDSHRVGVYDKPMAIPPHKEVKEQRYHYHECPLDPLPPIDHRTFFHYFWNSELHASCQSRLFFDRMPKKLHSSILKQSVPNQLTLGWGVHIIEGPNKPLLSLCLCVILILSFVVSLTIAFAMRTQESGFGVGQWMVATLSAALAAVYFHLAES